MKINQELKYNKDSRERIKAGIDKTVNAVKLTLGPEGRNVAIVHDNFQLFTKDGVTVAESINLKDPYEAVGNEAVKEAARKTNVQGGDGTTVTSIAVQALVEAGFSAVESGISPISLVRGIKQAVQAVNEFLTKLATPIKDYQSIKNVASIAANDKEMGTHIANLFAKLGPEGVIVVEETKDVGYREEYIKGMQWDKGMTAPFMTTETIRYKADVTNPLILFTDDVIENGEPVYAILEKMHQEGYTKLVIVANDISGKALEALAVNNRNIVKDGKRGLFVTLAVRAPYATASQLEALEDMAVLTNATVISKGKGMMLPKKVEEVDLSLLGTATKVVSDPQRTVIIGGQGKKKAIEQRISKLREDLKKEERDWERTKLKERLARLTGEVAVLYFGAENESIAKEMKYRIEDSVNATRNALAEGIVPGGEVALLRASQALKLELADNQQRGVEIVRQALRQPIDELAKNAGNVGSQVIKKILANPSLTYGWDAAQDEYCDLVKRGIIDPVIVVKAAITNAAASCCLLLTTEATIVDEAPEKRNDDYRKNQ